MKGIKKLLLSIITVAVSGGALKITVRAQVAEKLSRSLQI